MRLIFAILFVILFIRYEAFAKPHLILKNDFNGDGVADRVIFASYGTSGFFQSGGLNKKIDTFYLKQGNRSILFAPSTHGEKFVKLTEDAGIFTTVVIMKHEKQSFKFVNAYVVPSRTYFSDDPFADPFSTPTTTSCSDNSAFNNKSTNEALTWSEALKKYSIEDSVKKSIDPECKKVFGDDYPKMEKQIVAACGVSDGKPEKNNLVNCLDQNKNTQFLGGVYKATLAQNLFDNEFKISCSTSNKKIPLASFDSSSKKISIFKTSPEDPSRNFKADFFHEMMHSSDVDSEKQVQALVENCTDGKTGLNSKIKDKLANSETDRYYTNLDSYTANKKDGVAVDIPPQTKTVPQTSVASAVSEGSKALDSNFSMDNETQYDSLSKVSQATFKSFDPIMKAAYQAAVPTAFAQGSIEIPSGGTASTATTTSLATVKAAGSSRSIASTSTSGATYDVSNLPDSVPASANGELGNGLSVKATTVSAKAAQPRNPASSGSGGETGTSSAGGSDAGNVGSDSVGYKPTTDRPDLRNNVPQLKAEEDFVKTLTTGKYEDVKARLTDPKNQKILEDKRIQYVARDRTLGSKQPVMILKDLGNKFSVVRVTIE